MEVQIQFEIHVIGIYGVIRKGHDIRLAPET